MEEEPEDDSELSGFHAWLHKPGAYTLVLLLIFLFQVVTCYIICTYSRKKISAASNAIKTDAQEFLVF